jgi:hypothetical protein
MRVLGMPLWPEKVSDEQYVERVRKRLRTMRRWRYLTGAIGLGVLGLTIWLLLLTIHLLSDVDNMTKTIGHGTPTPQQQAVYGVYAIAIMLGFSFGFMLFNAIFHIASAFFEYRKDKLLVECWDSLSDAERGRLRQMSS